MRADEFARDYPALAEELTDTLRAFPQPLRIGLRPAWNRAMTTCLVADLVWLTVAVTAVVWLACSDVSRWWLIAPGLLGLHAVGRMWELARTVRVRRYLNAYVRREIAIEQAMDEGGRPR